MKKIFIPLIALVLFSLLDFGCTKPPDYPDEPQIEFVSWSRTIVNQESDSLWLNISFTDGDGDIGDLEDNNEPFVFFIDKRTNLGGFQDVTLPLVPQQGAGNGISGDISVKVIGACCLNISTPCVPSSEMQFDTVVYEVYIKDQAGNESNTITTDPVLIRCGS